MGIPAANAERVTVSGLEHELQRLRSEVARLYLALKDQDELRCLKNQLEEQVTATEGKRKAAELELAERAQLFSGTNTLLAELASLPIGEDIRSVVARGLRCLAGATAAFCSDFDPQRRTLRLGGMDVEADVLQQVTVALGQRVEDMEFPVTDETYGQIVAGIVGRVPTVTEVSFGVIPPNVGAAVQRLLRAERFIGLAHVIDGKLFGTSILSLQAGQPDPPKDWLESVAHLVAISLRRRRAEEELNRSEQEYRLLFETANDFVFLHELNDERNPGRFLKVNDLACRRLGYTHDELRQLRLVDIIAVNCGSLRQEVQSDADNQERIVETSLVAKGGDLFPVELRTRYFYREGQRLVLSIGRDIARRRLAIQELQKSEHLARTLLNSTGDLTHLLDEDGTILDLNAAMAASLGASREELIGTCVFDRFSDPAVRRRRETFFRRAVQENKPIRFSDARGQRFFDSSIYPVQTPKGKKRQFVVSVHDVTEHKRTEELLRLKNLVFDRSIAANSIADANGVITEVNGTFLRIWGYPSRAEAIGRPISDFLHDPQLARTIVGVLNDTGIWQGEYRARRKDGSTFLAYGLATSLTNDESQIIGYQSAVLDVSERERAKEALVESEARFRVLAENSLSGVYIVEDGRFRYVNPALAEIAGYSRDELIGAEIEKLIHPEDRSVVQENIRRRMAREVDAVRYEFRVVRKSGEVINVLVLGVVADLGTGRRVLIGNLLDVTGRKRAEQEAANQMRFERLLAELSSRIATAPLEQLDATISDAQRLMCEFLDADLSSIYRPCADKTKSLELTYLYLRPGITFPPVPEELRSDAYFPWCQRELLSGRILSVASTQDLPEEAVRDRLSWQHFGIKSSLMFPLVAANNEVIGTLSFDTVTKQRSWSDETRSRLRLLAQTMASALARKRSEAELRDSEERFGATFHQAAVGIAQVGPAGEWFEVNQKLCDILGYSPDELSQMTFQGITHSDDLDADMTQLRRMLADEIQTCSLEKRYIRKDGSLVWVFLTVACVRNPDRSVRYFISVVDDITDRKRAEEERRQLQAKLAQSDRLASMGMLAAGVAHEINNPLAYILYNLESLSETLPRYARQLAGARQALTERLGEELGEILGVNSEVLNASAWLDATERLKDAVQGTRRIREIARGLGAFSRVERDQLTPVDLRYPIESAFSLASNEIKYRAQVVKDIGSTAPVLGSEGRLSQVFLNLLVNAAYAIKEGDVEHNTIRVRTWQEGSAVLAEVQDTGCGIPPDDLDRIFDPFFTTKPAEVGSGLGLSIVHSIVAGYGGTIQVQSKVGEGTRFLIRLPAYTGQQAAEGDAARAARAAAPRRGRVLAIDDEPGILRALRRILNDHEVVEAESGEQAIDLLSRDQGFDVILCDVMMRTTSGIDVHRWLLAHYPRIARRVVFLTGGAFTPNARNYLEKVENIRVEKPFDTTHLLDLVAERVLAVRTNE